MQWDWGNGGSSDIYHDPQTLKNSITTRKNLARLTEALLKEGKKDKAARVIDLAMKNMPPEHYGFYFITEPYADGYYKVGNKAAAHKLLDFLMGKYRESLTYYNSLSAADQNRMAWDIMGDLERYRNLLIIMEENNDTEFLKASRPAFEKFDRIFARFQAPTE